MIGIAVGGWSFVAARLSPPATRWTGDFVYPWLAARAILAGIDPYAAIAASHLREPYFFYPFTAGIVVIPLAPFSLLVAASCFAGLSFGWLAFLLTREGQWWRLLILMSATAWQAMYSTQWTPLLMAASLSVFGLALLCVKPSLAIPLLAAQTSRRALWLAVVGGGSLIALAFAMQPHWLTHWYTVTQSTPLVEQYQMPIRSVWGLPLLFAALRWRRAEARLLLGMACVPQNFLPYDQFPLMLIAATRRQALVLALISWLVVAVRALASSPFTTAVRFGHAYGPLLIVGLYWPALVLVLCRPNTTDARP